MYYGSERYGEGGELVSVNTIITLIFFLNGINVLEDACNCSTEKEGKLTVITQPLSTSPQTFAVILPWNVATVDSAEEKMSLGRRVAAKP